MSKEPHLLDILPQNLKHDQSDNNVFKAIGDSEKKLYLRVDKSLLNDDNLEEQTMDVLTHLLWEEHLIKRREGLALSKTKKEIANLIKSSVELHRYKGTPYAVERALEVVGLKGRKEEWFEYDGEPYHFWVELQLNQKLNDLDLIFEMIEEYKNTRSWFDGFVVLALEQGFLYWDDSYSYPVYYKTCGEFFGNARTKNETLGGHLYADDSYSYPVYYEESIVQFHDVDTNSGLTIENDSYSYPIYHSECGELETPDTTSIQFEGAVDMEFEAYSYPTYYKECGNFEAGE